MAIRSALFALFFLLSFANPSHSQIGSVESLTVPSSQFSIWVGDGERAGNTTNCAADPTKYVVPPFAGPVALIITTWQSNIESAALGTYSTINNTALNFSLCDHGIYKCENPVLGAGINPPNTNSANCQIADGLITGGTYGTVIMATNAVGGASCADWVGGVLARRIVVTVNGLAARGLTAATGFTGDTFVIMHGGEQDNFLNTPQATLATCIRNYDAAYASAGLGTHRTFVSIESMVNNVTSAAVQGAEFDAIATGCSNCRLGFNLDNLTGGTNRQGDGTHLTAVGAAAEAAGDVTKVQGCVGMSCGIFLFGAFSVRRRRPANDDEKRRAAA